MLIGPPLLFVFLWSTGFISAKYGLPSAEPFTFLGIRMTLTSVILLSLLPFIKTVWPTRAIDYLNVAISGLLIHGVYLGGVFYAISLGLPTSVSAIIIGLQPLITIVIATLWLGESLTFQKISGLVLGFAGILLVVGHQGISSGGINYPGVFLCTISLIGISIGATYQKKLCTKIELLPSVIIQFVVNAIVLVSLAFLFEDRTVIWNPSFIFALSWLVIVLSVGTSMLLLWLIKNGEAGKVSSLFYLVPPFVAVEAWILFDETFGVPAMFGIIACVVGVAMVIKPPKSSKS